MKHKTIVRIALKLLGVYLIALGLPTALSTSFNVMISLTPLNVNSGQSIFGPNGQWQWMLSSVLYFGTQIAVGAYLLFGGGWIVNLIVPSNRAYCPECGYELHGPAQRQCSECGLTLPRRLTQTIKEQPQHTTAE